MRRAEEARRTLRRSGVFKLGSYQRRPVFNLSCLSRARAENNKSPETSSGVHGVEQVQASGRSKTQR